MSRTLPQSPPRSRRLLAAVAIAAIALAACGGDDDSDAADATAATVPVEASTPPAASDAPSATDAPDAAAFPVTIKNKFGSTTVPAAPERVVSVGYTDQDYLLALGVTPIAIRDWYGDQPYGTWPWAQDELGSAQPTLLSDADLNVEQIAALKPDLIVGISSGMTKEQYDTLSKIAPTIAQPDDFVDYGTPWQDQTLLTGQAVGKAAEAQALVDDIEGQFAAARDAHPEFDGQTAAVAFFYNDQPGAYSSQDGRSRVMTDLGFTIPKEFDDLAGESFFASFSGEQIDLLNTNALVWIGGDELTIKALLDSPLRGGLKAAQEGRELFMDVDLGAAFSFGDPLSLPYLLDKLVPELALAIDGDPSTPVPSAVAAGATTPSTGSTTDTTGTTGTDADAASAASAAWTLVFDSTADVAEKTAHVEDGDALQSTMTDYKTAGDAMGGFSVVPSDTTVDGDTATVTYDILFGGTSAGYPPQTGTLHLIDGTWVVSHADFCSFMTSARLSCPA